MLMMLPIWVAIGAVLVWQREDIMEGKELALERHSNSDRQAIWNCLSGISLRGLTLHRPSRRRDFGWLWGSEDERDYLMNNARDHVVFVEEAEAGANVRFYTLEGRPLRDGELQHFERCLD